MRLVIDDDSDSESSLKPKSFNEPGADRRESSNHDQQFLGETVNNSNEMRRRIEIDSDSDVESSDSSASSESFIASDEESDDSSVDEILILDDKKLLGKSKKARNAHTDSTSQSGYLSDDSSSLGGYIAGLSIAPAKDEGALETSEQAAIVETPFDEDSAWSCDVARKEFFLDSTKGEASWPQLRLPYRLFKQLYDFQRGGVEWIASLHEKKIGGILGDDMGMGKTYTSLSCLGGLMRGGTIQNALVVAPLSVLRNWEKEATKILSRCVRNIKIKVLSSNETPVSRRRILSEATKQTSSNRCHLVITTYGLVRSAEADFSRNGVFQYVVLDEAHTIKNPKAAVSKSCRAICENPETRRLILTGTPILNNLNELWSLFDFATSGAVLGDEKEFKQKFGRPIEHARDKNATEYDVQNAERKNKELQTLLKPYFLQRLKIDYLKNKLPPKKELVVWTHLSTQQRQMYEEFLQNNDAVYCILRGEKLSPLVALTELKKLCSHPCLLQEQELDSMNVSLSAKLGVTLRLVKHLRNSNHRALIFSQSTKMLDILEDVLEEENVVLSRIDGSTKERERQLNVDEFNRDNSKTEVMLLSTKAAGVGLTLTGADTVIVYDPSWTPAEDSQAVDRAYRLGQDKPVTVFRLITAGTVEEKMYERQIHKDGIRRAVLDAEGKNIERYFNRHELRELFKLAPVGVCKVMDQVAEAIRGQDVGLGEQNFVHDIKGVVGMSRHDGFYKNTSKEPEHAEQTSYKVLGKSQRVLQRVEQNLVKADVPEHNLKKPPTSSNQNQSSTSPLEQMQQAEAAGKPKLALKLGVELLNSAQSDLNDSSRLELHNAMGRLGASLGLVDGK